ncbi:rhodanese-like domain-containing protein [Novipirellula artificiosorum]|uniref:Putative adenylyltransferase/sulfurtransferase MoeZ n=1 Tax=Novipirellula artificiosorum TaxID=2528016 RepID=A0A5C6DJZ0_9BACT|nr:rhodanese-like domain-containing protein [Novipirellula artificiosorum]TWU37058.1 putative adenylyltransferase/sulfurtransferase MoeZ [Novipirellula artificiosorum]
MTNSEELPIQIDVPTVAKMLRRGDNFLLLDVRESSEYAIAKINGSTLVPMSELAGRAAELDPHQDRLIVVHCHHGGRSLQVTHALKASGFRKVQNMEGGIDQWSLQIDSSVPRY